MAAKSRNIKIPEMKTGFAGILLYMATGLPCAFGGDGKVPVSWYALAEDYPEKILDEFDWEDPDEDLVDEVDDLYEAQGDSYDELPVRLVTISFSTQNKFCRIRKTCFFF